MLWLFLAGALLAIGFIQLGAMSVWVVVLSITLKILLLIAVAVALCFAMIYLWRRYRNPVWRSSWPPTRSRRNIPQ